MVFRTGKKQLTCISELFQGKNNGIYICEDRENQEKYCLWAVKNHRLAGQLTEYFEGESIPENTEIFSMGKIYYVMFPYREERKFTDFFPIESGSQEEAKELCRRAVFLCLTCGFPMPVLYLLLKQDCLNIGRDKSVYFTCRINLDELQMRTEAECTCCLSAYLEQMLEITGNTSWTGYRLMKMKNSRQHYKKFADLYQDIQSGVKMNKAGTFFDRCKRHLNEKKPVFLRILKVLCVLTGIVALIVLFGDLLFGESPFTRLFVNSFKMIGTESMLQ